MCNCLFCDIANHSKKVFTILEDSDICCFLDHDPINPGHILIIPKKHFLDIDEMNEKIIFKIFTTAKTIVKVLKDIYKPDGYTMMQNGGQFNDIGHFHLHLFPRYEQDGFSWVCNQTKNIDFELISKQIINEIKKVNDSL